MAAMERTLVLLKPDAVHRRLVGRTVARLEAKGLKLAAASFLRLSREAAEDLYSVHEGKEFYERLLTFIVSGPVFATVWEGVGAIAVVRTLVGSTFGPDAAPGTLRGDFGLSRRHNVVHASDSPEVAAREIAVFFRPDQIVSYDLCDQDWTYARGPEGLV